MERFKIDLPERFFFETELRVRISDINYGGHLGHDSLLTLMQEARIRFLEKYGFSELDVQGRGMLVRDAAVIYKKEVFHGQVLKFEIGAANLQNRCFDFIYRVTDLPSGIEAARGRIGIVFFDYDKKKCVCVPDSFKDIIKNFTGRV